MSETQIVNRTPETLGQQIERQRIEAETVKEERSAQIDKLLTVAGVVVGRNLKVEEIGIAKPGDGIVKEPTPSAAPVAPDFSVSSEQAPDTQSLTEEAGNKILGNVLLARDPDLAGFKAQVIAAFKHLGLDTRKFFGV